MTKGRAIGSVLPLPEADCPDAADSLWATWTRGHAYASAYATARGALAALLDARHPRRLWLPAYVCDAVRDAAAGGEMVWYNVDAQLRPDAAALSADLAEGDAVLAVDYFGRPPPPAFLALAQARPDVLWIEDCAQAMAAALWGEVLLFSPRKLIGVGDGGLLISDGVLPLPGAATRPLVSTAQKARRADPDGLDPQSWFPLFQAQEAAIRVDFEPMSAETRVLLAQVAAEPLAAARAANFNTLASRLDAFALWPGLRADFAPLAFPVLVDDRDAVVERMADHGIFCARHWPDLPSPARFTIAHDLSGKLLSLPCDHRYGEADMIRIADTLQAVARPVRV